jgi:hypothetical protein
MITILSQRLENEPGGEGGLTFSQRMQVTKAHGRNISVGLCVLVGAKELSWLARQVS